MEMERSRDDCLVVHGSIPLTMKQAEIAIRVNGTMAHGPSRVAGRASIGSEGHPTMNKGFPGCAVSHPRSVFKLTQPVHWPQSAPSPELPALGSQNSGMSLNAAGCFDLPSKSLEAAVHYLNTTSRI